MSKIPDMNSYIDEDNFIQESKAINENNIDLIKILNSEQNNPNFITDFTSKYRNLILTENIPHTNLNIISNIDFSNNNENHNLNFTENIPHTNLNIFSNNDFSNNNDYHNLNLTPPTNFNNTFRNIYYTNYNENLILNLTENNISFNINENDELFGIYDIRNLDCLNDNYFLTKKSFKDSFDEPDKEDLYFSSKNKKAIFKTEKQPRNIKLYVFSIDQFKIDYKPENNNITNTEEPLFFGIEDIKKIPNIASIWSGEGNIFKNEEDFDNTIKNGKIYKNMFNALNGIKEKVDLKRSQEPDEMSKRIKTLVMQQSINSANKFDEFKYNELEMIDKNKISEQIKADFQLCLLEQKIYSIVSNDIKSKNPKCNYNKIKKIINEFNKDNNKHAPLIDLLCLTFEDCLNIILYKKEDMFIDKIEEGKVQKISLFDKKLIEFLYDIYKSLKYEEEIKKDYIAAMILLAYNFKRLFYLKPKRNFRSNN